jgi:hypothetical protein
MASATCGRCQQSEAVVMISLMASGATEYCCLACLPPWLVDFYLVVANVPLIIDIAESDAIEQAEHEDGSVTPAPVAAKRRARTKAKATVGASNGAVSETAETSDD